MKLDLKKMDMDSLDELIRKCEDSMISPFRKKKEPVVEEEDRRFFVDKAEEDSGEEKPDLSDMDMEELLRMYQQMKDKE